MDDPGSGRDRLEPVSRPPPAFYATRPGVWRDWWNVLHPPYTAWHLSYVVIGAALAPHVVPSRLIATVIAFFLAVGIAAHALDELRDRPLGTRIPSSLLVAVSALSLAGAVALGVAGLSKIGWPLLPFLVLGPLLVLAYNLEWFGGVIHTDVGFAAAWGSFPVLTAYVAQAGGPVGRSHPGGRLRACAVGRPAAAQHPGPAGPPADGPRGGARGAPGRSGACPSTSEPCWPRSRPPCGPFRGRFACWRRPSPSPAWADPPDRRNGPLRPGWRYRPPASGTAPPPPHAPRPDPARWIRWARASPTAARRTNGCMASHGRFHVMRSAIPQAVFTPARMAAMASSRRA